MTVSTSPGVSPSTAIWSVPGRTVKVAGAFGSVVVAAGAVSGVVVTTEVGGPVVGVGVDMEEVSEEPEQPATNAATTISPASRRRTGRLSHG